MGLNGQGLLWIGYSKDRHLRGAIDTVRHKYCASGREVSAGLSLQRCWYCQISNVNSQFLFLLHSHRLAGSFFATRWNVLLAFQVDCFTW